MGLRRALTVAVLVTAVLAAPASALGADGGAAPLPGPVPSTARASVHTGGAPDRPVPRPAAPQRHVGPNPAPVLPTAPVPGGGRFPIAGSHSYGGADARFGAARTGHVHQGQDVFAAEGTPLVAPVPGQIAWRGDQPKGAGLYLVLHSAASGRDYVFMHLRPGSILAAAGAAVRVGQLLAQVGHTGDAQGPHLHFEVWVGGWYAKGGHPVDPLPTLKHWER